MFGRSKKTDGDSLSAVQKIPPAKRIALVAVYAALMTGGKYALQLIPNVEIVTLLIVVFVCVSGFVQTLSATLIFCLLDMVLYPFSVDVAVSYIVYYPAVVAILSAVNASAQKSEYVNALIAACCTVLFGIITSIMFAVFFMPPDKFLSAYMAVYASGIPFFAVHAASNFGIVLLCSPTLIRLGKKVLGQY